MKIIEYTYENGSHSYSTSSMVTMEIDGIGHVGANEYEVPDGLGRAFMDNVDQYTFTKGEIYPKS